VGLRPRPRRARGARRHGGAVNGLAVPQGRRDGPGAPPGWPRPGGVPAVPGAGDPGAGLFTADLLNGTKAYVLAVIEHGNRAPGSWAPPSTRSIPGRPARPEPAHGPGGCRDTSEVRRPRSRTQSGGLAAAGVSSGPDPDLEPAPPHSPGCGSVRPPPFRSATSSSCAGGCRSAARCSERAVARWRSGRPSTAANGPSTSRASWSRSWPRTYGITALAPIRAAGCSAARRRIGTRSATGGGTGDGDDLR